MGKVEEEGVLREIGIGIGMKGKRLLQLRLMTKRMGISYHYYYYYLMVLALPLLLAQFTTTIHQDHNLNNYNHINYIVTITTTTSPHPLLLPTTPLAYASDIDDLVHQALTKIREADSAGTDTSHLVERLNTALSIIRQVEHGDLPGSCSSRDECLATAIDMLNSIADDAVTLHKQKVRENTERFYMNLLVYAPIGALASSVASTILYVNLKGYMQARMMEMDVREVKEE
jgi:hypothetical protein